MKKKRVISEDRAGLYTTATLKARLFRFLNDRSRQVFDEEL